MASPDGYPQLHFPDREAWREWLEENHAARRGVWVVFYKKGTGEKTMQYAESVEEALCYGWVDSRTRRLDDRRYLLMFTPRNPKSPWSRPNKERVERLVARGVMAAAGLAVVDEAKRNGAWTVYDPIEDLVVPQDLAAAFSARKPAADNYERMTVSVKKGILWWIASARRPDTRARRIAKTVEAVSRNRSPL